MTTTDEETRESRERPESEGRPEAELLCPFCQFLAALHRLAGPESEFYRHLQMSRVEFYKALRSLIDQRIATLEKATQAKSQQGYRHIKVEAG